MNWYLILIIGFAAMLLLIYLVVVNFRDRKKFEQQLNSDYKKTKDEEDEMEIE